MRQQLTFVTCKQQHCLCSFMSFTVFLVFLVS